MPVFKDFPGLENLEKNSRTFKDLQQPFSTGCLQKGIIKVSNHYLVVIEHIFVKCCIQQGKNYASWMPLLSPDQQCQSTEGTMLQWHLNSLIIFIDPNKQLNSRILNVKIDYT